jgi:glutamine---fructose-6-phosphate transaminase (isomerizing)
MCGIIAYKGPKKASEVLLKGIKTLEYRGYDSIGMAVLSNGLIEVRKDAGKIDEVNEKLNFSSMEGNAGIAHTRWSTHGGITKENSHPHMDCSGKIAIAHNGIIDNYQLLKKELGSQNHKIVSQTDTELIPHLIEKLLGEGIDFQEAVRKTAGMLKGRSAFVALDADTGLIAAARKGTPLIVGVNQGKSEFFIASDVNAFTDSTKEVMYLDDGEMVVVDGEIKFLSLDNGKEISKRVVTIDWEVDKAEKGGYAHFMIKEIMEQKDTLKKAINQDDDKIISVAESIKNAFGTFFVGCGTAGKVCMAGEYMFSRIAKKHVNYSVASEFSNYHHYLKPTSLMVAVSQSGETADVLEAIDVAKSKGVKIISLLNVFGSTMMRESDDYFMVNAGVERAVVSTKATTAQLAVMMLLAYAAAGNLQEGKLLLMNASSAVNDMLNPRYEEHIRQLAGILAKRKDLFIIGKGMNYPMALEAAIKFQETCYISAEGLAAGELKHGPLALIDEGTPCIALVANDENKDDTISNAMEVKSRGGYIIGVSPENNEVFDYWIKVPDVGNASPLVNIIPLQILAYHIAVMKGLDPDYPRNLAKSVSVK